MSDPVAREDRRIRSERRYAALKNDPDFRRRAAVRAQNWHSANPHKKRTSDRRRYHLETYGEVLETSEQIVAHSKDRFAAARALGFRSGLEVKIAKQLKDAGSPVLYEQFKVHYVRPERSCTYTPDYILPNGVVVETKGRFLTEDRQKSKHIKSQYPDLDLRFIFGDANARLTKVSKTTYAKWSDQYGFKWAHKDIPLSWLQEPPCPKRIAALKEATRGAFNI